MPITGKEIVVTSPIESGEKLKDLLETQGAKAVLFPTIETIIPELSAEILEALENIQNYDWLVFTSKKGVQAFFYFLTKVKEKKQLPESLKIVLIGKKTAIELEKYGHSADFINQGNTSDDFIVNFENVIKNKSSKILLALGNLAPDKIKNAFSERHTLDRINVYETQIPQNFDTQKLKEIKNNNFDFIIFTSPSAFYNFILITDFDNKQLENKIITIGDTTTNAIEKRGYKVAITARKSTMEGIIETIIK